MGLFRKPPKPEEWGRIEAQLEEGEVQVASSSGWLVGASIGDNIDHPCGVYLTDRALYVDIRPQTLLEARVVRVPFDTVVKAGLQPSDIGAPRLVVMHGGDRDQNVLPDGLAVDLPKRRAGTEFGEQVISAMERPMTPAERNLDRARRELAESEASGKLDQFAWAAVKQAEAEVRRERGEM